MNHTRLPSLFSPRLGRGWADLQLKGPDELRTLRHHFKTSDNATLFLRIQLWLLSNSTKSTYSDVVEDEAWWHAFDMREESNLKLMSEI